MPETMCCKGLTYKFSKKVGEAELLSVVNELKCSGTALCIYTDRVTCELFSEIKDCAHLLEIRIFNDDCEFRAARTVLGADFGCRLADDKFFAETCADSYRAVDEKQYLDIDAVKSTPEKGEYTATGGGRFSLPVTDAEKIVIRNYFVYDEDNAVHFEDFRIVSIKRKGEE